MTTRSETPPLAGWLRAVPLAVAAAQVVPLSAEVAPTEPIVRRVEIRSDVELEDPQQTLDLIALRPGEPFRSEAVRESLRNLQAAGEAGEMEAYAVPFEDGVQVSFALWAKVWVEEVRLEGEFGLKVSELRRLLPQQAEQPLLESRILRGIYRLQDLYQAEGYLNARVRLEMDVDGRRKRATVTYRIDSREPATVASVDFECDLGPFDADRLRERLHAAAGRRFREETVDTDAERLEGFLLEQGHRLAVVEPPRRQVDPEGRQVALVYPVSVGPRFEIRVLGADQKLLAKRKLLPLQGRERFDEAALLQALEKLRSHYQERGHYRVRIDRSEERSEDLVRLLLSIDPGPVYQLESIRFEGNHEIAAGELEAVILTSTRRRLAGGSGRLVDRVLAEDLAALKSFYRLKGYRSVEVGPPQIESRDERLAVIIPIREGPQQRAVQVAMFGAQALDAGDLLRQLPLKAGGPFHPRLLEESLERIRASYEEQGYESTQVAPTLDWNSDGTRVDVTLRVLEGPRSTVDRIIVRGNRRTRSAILRRTIGLEPGEPLNTSRLLEVQRNLYSLGIFSRVEVDRAPGTPFSGQRDVLIRVEEGDRQ
ncbi:MAG: POTRA domain-containing protein, partial [Thermoanaerobaculia bacterium]